MKKTEIKELKKKNELMRLKNLTLSTASILHSESLGGESCCCSVGTKDKAVYVNHSHPKAMC